MLDIRFVRENPDVVKQNIRNKFQDEKLPLVKEVIELDERSRELKTKGDSLRAEKNKLSKQIGACMAKGMKDDAEELKRRVAADAEELESMEKEQAELDEKIKKIM